MLFLINFDIWEVQLIFRNISFEYNLSNSLCTNTFVKTPNRTVCDMHASFHTLALRQNSYVSITTICRIKVVINCIKFIITRAHVSLVP